MTTSHVDGGWHLIASERRADFLGYPNWHTMNTALMADNEEKHYNKLRDLVGKGGTADDVRDYTLRHVIGPYNKQTIQDARDWNSIPKDERIDHHYEDLKNKNPQAADLVNSLGFGPDVEDDEPDLIDPELVDWDRIHGDISDELDGNDAYDREMADYRNKGIGWATNHDEHTNQMRDAFLRNRGYAPEDEIGGDYSTYSKDPRYIYNRPVQIPWEQAQHMDWQRDHLDDRGMRDALFKHRDQIARQKATEQLAAQGLDPDQIAHALDPMDANGKYDRWAPDHIRQHFPGGKYDTPVNMDDPAEAAIFNNDPNVQHIMQNGITKHPQDLAADVIHAIRNGKPHPFIPEMQQALQARGYTPEQIAPMMQQQWQWDPETNQRIPVNQAPPVEQWTQQAQQQQQMDQPGSWTFPQEWA